MLSTNGQTISLTPFSFDNDLKVMQLSGDIDIDHSLTIRPFRFSKRFSPDSFYKKLSTTQEKPIQELKKSFWGNRGKISLLPLNLVSKYASHHPYGWSDGALMQSKGFQSVSSLGVFASIGPIEIQLNPEFLYASNPSYEGNQYYGSRRPQKGLKRFYPGQSRIDLNINAFSVGFSSENIWWGSGQFTTLMMTNNAPGFIHANFQTRRPLKTAIGSFEMQVIAGALNANDSLPEEVYDGLSLSDAGGFITKQGDYLKYINGVNLVYSPKFINGLSIGFNRVYVSPNLQTLSLVRSKLGLSKTFLPIFDIVFKEKRLDGSEDSLLWNQLINFHARYFLPKANIEFYGEYGWNDHKVNIRDLLMSTTHSAAFLIGVKKVIKTNNNKFIDINLEYNNMAPTTDYLVRDAGSWYIHGFYGNLSHYGEILGAGSGYGSNLFTYSTTLRSGFSQIGLKYERVNRFPNRLAYNWIDNAVTVSARKKVSHLLLNIQLTGVNSNNYAWMNNRDRFNVLGMCGLSYYW